MRVLVVDDDLDSRLAAQEAVEALGHECAVASGGEEGWRLYLRWRPEVLVADRAMPGMDGAQLCQAVRAAEAGRSTYVILVSEADDRADLASFVEAGADDHLVKPVDTFTLQVRMLAAARVTRLREELARAQEALSAQSHTDPLTGLANRAGLEDRLEALHSSSRRYGRAYCLALCDVDFFQEYNDRYGHPAGDDVLRAVAATLTRLARDADQVYRFGGEEFLLVLPEQEEAGAVRALERVRQAVEDLHIVHPGGAPGGFLTLSVGIACFTPGREVSSSTMLAEADVALYQAKAAGRNAVAGPGSPAGTQAREDD